MKVILVFGTRPEAIKMCPVIKELKKHDEIKTIVCLTGQHKDMLASILDIFHVQADYDLEIMQKSQTLFDITDKVLDGMRFVFEKEQPDAVLVHGDTTSAFAASLACFYMKIPVCHVEAGLRTYDLYAPYPEEFNRQAIDAISELLFAPTRQTMENLLKEGKNAEKIFVTGNTVIDALKTTIQDGYGSELLEWAEGYRLILLTAHRRESWGVAMQNMFLAVAKIVERFKDVKVIYPVHPNPAVRRIAAETLGNASRVRLVEPLDVIDFHNLMNHAYLILTDSGGIQEEASALGKPVLVMRDMTERPEGVAEGILKLVGTDMSRIEESAAELLTNREAYGQMSKAGNPYGDGKASERIVKILIEEMKGMEHHAASI